MRNNLVPVQRMDKNGRLVTRHVRDDASKATGLKVPSPQSVPHAAKRRQDAIDFAVLYIAAMTGSKHNLVDGMPDEIRNWGKDNWRSALEALNDRTVNEIHAALDKGGDGVHQLVMSCLYHRYRAPVIADLLIATQYDSERSNNWYDNVSASSHSAENMLSALYGYYETGWEVPKHISTASARDRGIAEALIKAKETTMDVPGALAYSRSGAFKLNDGIAQLIVDRPSDVDSICDIMVSRRTANAALVEETLNNAAPAIRDGVL